MITFVIAQVKMIVLKTSLNNQVDLFGLLIVFAYKFLSFIIIGRRQKNETLNLYNDFDTLVHNHQ